MQNFLKLFFLSVANSENVKRIVESVLVYLKKTTSSKHKNAAIAHKPVLQVKMATAEAIQEHVLGIYKVIEKYSQVPILFFYFYRKKKKLG